MQITLAQIQPKLSDITYNTNKIINIITNTKTDLIIFPELSLCGYLLQDSIFNYNNTTQINSALNKIQLATKNKTVILGYPKLHKNKYLNTAIIFQNNKIIGEYHKRSLADFECFNETRHFIAGTNSLTITINNYKFAISICNDIWDQATVRSICSKPVDAIINISASPYYVNKDQARLSTLYTAAKLHSCDIIYVNTVGAHDGIIFDGNSKIISKQKLTHQLKSCDEEIYTYNFASNHQPKPFQQPKKMQELLNALKLGIHEYLNNNNIQQVYIGISGGLDSAVVAALTVMTIGNKRVTGIMMPSEYTSEISITAATQLTSQLGIELITNTITPALNLLVAQLTGSKVNPNKIAQQNLQARIRGIILMYYANTYNGVVLNTGNKSELAMGYCTLYGDMLGALAPIGDLTKTEVIKLANYINYNTNIIPQAIISRPPSAELAPNQKDTDQLLEYPKLDKALNKIFSLEQGANISLNNEELKIYQTLKQHEHKRRQSPPVIKVSNYSFSHDRNQPITIG